MKIPNSTTKNIKQKNVLLLKIMQCQNQTYHICWYVHRKLHPDIRLSSLALILNKQKTILCLRLTHMLMLKNKMKVCMYMNISFG